MSHDYGSGDMGSQSSRRTRYILSEPPVERHAGQGLLFECRCRRSDKGKVTQKLEIGPMGRAHFSYAYDQAGHLTEVHKDGGLAEYYEYDDSGRRVRDFRSWASDRRSLSYAYDGALIRVEAFRRARPELSPALCEFTWTGKGQLSTLVSDGRKDSFNYGADSRLDRALLADGTDVRYYYQNELLPVKVTVNNALAAEYQWQDNLRLLRHRDAARGLTHDFVYGEGRAPLRVTVSGSALAVRRATGLDSRRVTLDIFTDQVDSIRALILPDGQAVKCMEYDSFGNLTADSRPEWSFPLGFACGLKDPWTGFLRFGYRDYDPRVGRFTARDPIGDTGGDHDLWDYCIDDPVGNLDPDGLLTRSAPWQSADPYSRDGARGVSEFLISDEERKAREAAGRQLGLGTRAVIDGTFDNLDTLAAPVRGVLNAGNSLMGGDPNFFRPGKGLLSDAIGLPKPETEAERRMFSFNESAASALSGAFVLGGTRAGMEAVNLAGKAVEKGVEKALQYAPVVYNTVVSTAKTAYDKARPVVKDAAAKVRDAPYRVQGELVARGLDEKFSKAVDIAEGVVVPVSPRLSSFSGKIGSAIKGIYDVSEANMSATLSTPVLSSSKQSFLNSHEPYIPYGYGHK